MKEENSFGSRLPFRIWAAAAAVFLTVYALRPGIFAGMGSGRAMGLFAFVILDALCLMICITGKICWIGAVTEDEAGAAGSGRRKRYALIQLLLCLGMTAVDLLYCYGPLPLPWSGNIHDALASSALLCIYALISFRVML